MEDINDRISRKPDDTDDDLDELLRGLDAKPDC